MDMHPLEREESRSVRITATKRRSTDVAKHQSPTGPPQRWSGPLPQDGVWRERLLAWQVSEVELRD